MRKELVICALFLILIIQISAYEFCDEGVVGEKDLRIISVDDMLIGNSYEWNWKNSDDIELEIRVQNRKDSSEEYEIELIFIEEGDDDVKIVKDSNDLKKEFSLGANERKSVSFKFQIKDDVDVGDYELYVKLYADGDEEEECVETSQQVNLRKIEICEDEADEDDLRIEEIIDERKDNDKEWEWMSGQEIEISVEVNNRDYDDREFTVELVLLDEKNEIVSFALDSEDVLKTIDLDEGESDTVNFDFDMARNLGGGEYSLYAKIYDSDDDDICASLRAEKKSSPVKIDIEKKDRNVVVVEVNGPTSVEKGSVNSYTVEVSNYGVKEEDRVMVTAYSHKIGVREEREIINLSEGSSETVEFEIKIPENVSYNSASILFYTKFDYDKKRGYRDSSDKSSNLDYIVKLNNKVVVEDEGNISVEVNNSDEEEIIPEENSTKNIEDVTKTPITGAVIGSEDNGYRKEIIIGVVLFAGIGGFFLYRRLKNKPKHYKSFSPKVTRKYTARVESSDLD